MDLFRRYGNLLRPDGTNQLQRLLPGLEPDYIVPDERSLSDLVAYASKVAAEIRFYDLNGQAAGDWAPFLDSLFDGNIPPQVLPPESLETLLAARSDWPAHLVLFLVFLKLFRNIQDDLNQLTARHLTYYYETYLGISRRAPVPDDVHVIFELARNAPATVLPAGTLLDAGKDENGRPLSYAIQRELLVSAASVSQIKRLVVERDRSLRRRFFTAEGFSALEGSSGYTFGRTQLDLDPSQRFMVEAPVGFAIAAPILALGEGVRTVTVLAHLRPPASAPPVVSRGIGYALDVTLSGAEGWLAPDSVEASLLADGGLGTPAISLTLTLGQALAAVVPFNSTLHGPGFSTRRPVLRCMLKGDSGLYDMLDGFVVEKVVLTANVTGVRNLVVQTTDGLLNPSQPMPLFGATPQIGSTFYVGSAEVFSKKLSTISLNLQWKSPVPDLLAYYAAYFDVIDSALRASFNDFFSVEVAILSDRVFQPLLFGQSLFSVVPAQARKIFADPTAFASTGYTAQPDLAAFTSYDPSSRFGFLRLVLTSPTQSDMANWAQKVPFEAFGHSAFARRYAYQAIALSQSPSPAGPTLPSQPYTPTLSSLSLDYTAAAEFTPGDPQAAETFLILGPFDPTRVGDAVPARVVPQIDGEAALMLGIANINVPTNLSLFFEIDVGTASATPILQPGETQWSCLDASGVWEPLSASSVLTDSTQGFQKPGIVSLAVPSQAALDHDSLPAGLVWLRALIPRPPESAARTSAIRPHATVAQFQPGALTDEDLAHHLDSALPAGTITRLVQRNANIKRIEQPDPSFGGRGQETDTGYFRRCSERLRHRNRAVTAWDFERLVLDAFPEVFKVKCLPHIDASGASKAGEIALVVVPNLLQTASANPLEPRAGDVLLEQINDYLLGLASPFATLHVIRPVFERIRVQAQVTFVAGRDPGFYSTVLNEDLKRFLSPWAFEDGEDILFGARIYRSEIIAFMEGRDYVDHLIDVRIYHSFDGPSSEGIGSMIIGVDFIVRPDPSPAISTMAINDDFVVGCGVEFAQTTQPHAILVSHPQHLIMAVAPGKEVCPGVTQLGIGYMTIDVDFKVQVA